MAPLGGAPRLASDHRPSHSARSGTARDERFDMMAWCFVDGRRAGKAAASWGWTVELLASRPRRDIRQPTATPEPAQSAPSHERCNACADEPILNPVYIGCRQPLRVLQELWQKMNPPLAEGRRREQSGYFYVGEICGALHGPVFLRHYRGTWRRSLSGRHSRSSGSFVHASFKGKTAAAFAKFRTPLQSVPHRQSQRWFSF